MTTRHIRLGRVLGAVLAVALTTLLVPVPAEADGVDVVWVNFDAPVATETNYAWAGSTYDPVEYYDVSASASSVRVAFPIRGTDAVPGTATIGLSASSFPGDCPTPAPAGVHLEGWTLVLDPAALVASPTTRCVTANPGTGYTLSVEAQGPRDTLKLSVRVRLVAGSTTTTVTLPEITPIHFERSYVTAPARVTDGSAFRLFGVGGDFDTFSSANVDLVGADGTSKGSLVGEASFKLSEVDVTLPDVLPDGAVAVRITTWPWGGPLNIIRVPLGAPLADPVAAYVTSVYANLFRRGPDPTGLAGWTAALKGGTPYGAVSDSITASAEFRTRLIQAAYSQYLHRSSDPAGLAAWLKAMNGGLRIQSMEAGFLASDESYARAGGTDQAWVASLYLAVLNRSSNTAEAAAWSNALARGASRYDVALGFTTSAEHLRTVVDGYYLSYLGRHSDPAGVRGWVAALQGRARAEQIVAGILASQEFRSRVPTA